MLYKCVIQTVLGMGMGMNVTAQVWLFGILQLDVSVSGVWPHANSTEWGASVQ